MLVLSRRCNEAIVVGAPDGMESEGKPFTQMLKVTVLGMSQGRVRLGFEIADEFPVHRWEVWERIRASVKGSPSLELLDGTKVAALSAAP